MRAALAAIALACLGAARPPLWLGPAPAPTPRRVVTLAPSLTEAVVALGAADRLVGVTRFDDAPVVLGLPRVGGYVDPSVEAVLALKPDLVLAEPSPGNRGAVERMGRLGLPVLAVPLSTREEVLSALRVVGAALGLTDEGERVAASLEARAAAVSRRAEGLRRPRALVVYDWDPLVVAGPGSFADSLLAVAGGVNAASRARTAYPVYSAESALRAAPEVLVDAADVRDPPRARLLELPGLKSARLVVASPSLFKPGPRMGEALENLFVLLHPEATGEER